MRYLVLVCFTFFILKNSFSQNRISGKIEDFTTKEPISNASIAMKDGTLLTISNEDGEFSFLEKKLPISLYITHIGYETITVSFEDTNFKNISLKQTVIQLPEFITNNPAVNYLSQAIKKCNEDSANIYTIQGYMRKQFQTGKKTKSLTEIFFKANFNVFGIQNWLPQNYRFINSEETNILPNLYNLVAFSRTGNISKSLLMPNSINTNLAMYELKVIRVSLIDSLRDIIEIKCAPKSKSENYFEGSISINTKTNNIINLNGTYYVKTDKQNKRHEISFTVNFIETDDKRSVFNNLQLKEKQRVGKSMINETTTIYAYEYLSHLETQNMVNIYKSKFDFKNLNYNSTYWKNEAVLKYTSSQKEAILLFNKSEKTKSNYVK